ncbi:stage 0 sporulation protein B (sporulation initiation phosphotransferase) [Neobacillus niacini]|nr:stage 0 sporulation protein B (sporulation initiation phosphotransferase) [Neobacillus niacini]
MDIIRIKKLTHAYFFDILSENGYRTINVGVQGMKDLDIVEVLRHSRHDWLNRLQLIKGNLDLNKIDRAKEIIDEIVIDTQQESKLSNLQMPMFASLLLKSNWDNHHFQLEFEVLSDTDSKKTDDHLLTNWTKSLFLSLNKAIEVFGENHLSITIDPQMDGARFFFDFSGIIIKSELIEQFLSQPQESELVLEVKEFSKNELAFEVFMPFLKKDKDCDSHR